MSEAIQPKARHAPLDPPIAESVQALFERERRNILERCTHCGRCFEVCPMAGDDPALAAADPGRTVEGVLAILLGRPGTPEALAWVQRCAKSGECDAHCPEPISPKMMMRIARIVALGALGDPAQITAREDPDYYNKVHAFARLQLTPGELEQWTVAPASRGPRRP